MQVHELTVMIGTDQPDALARFYGEILGLTRVERFADPVFEAAGGFIRILDHSEISGPTVEPARVQLNLFVDDVAAEFARITNTASPSTARQPANPGAARSPPSATPTATTSSYWRCSSSVLKTIASALSLPPLCGGRGRKSLPLRGSCRAATEGEARADLR